MKLGRLLNFASIILVFIALYLRESTGMPEPAYRFALWAMALAIGAQWRILNK